MLTSDDHVRLAIAKSARYRRYVTRQQEKRLYGFCSANKNLEKQQ